MKSFYSPVVDSPQGEKAAGVGAVVVPLFSSCAHARGRIAVYDDSAAAPRVEEVVAEAIADFIDTLASRVYELAAAQGGTVPFTVIREISENLIHARFSEPVVSILESGCTIRFADQGPGIADKERALLPGFTTASGEMKHFIRGVGSGLPIVREFLSHAGGSLVVEDNLGCGSVVTIFSRRRHDVGPDLRNAARSSDETVFGSLATGEQASLSDPGAEPSTAGPRLSTRQKQALALVLESGLAGPSLVAKELGVGVSTAYRDLASLEDAGLIVSESGKRTLTREGLSYLGGLSQTL